MDGGGTVDTCHNTLKSDNAEGFQAHNAVLATDRFHEPDDMYLATAILAGIPCRNDQEKAHCIQRGFEILNELPHHKKGKDNVLPTPAIIATMKKWKYVINASSVLK